MSMGDAIILLTLIAPAILLSAAALTAAVRKPTNDDAAHIRSGNALPSDAPENVKEA
jgi:hypothetical protein